MADIKHQDDSTKQFSSIKVQHVSAAIHCHTVKKLAMLQSEMDSYMEAKREATAQLSSKFPLMGITAGTELTMAQFEEYVKLQRKLMNTLKEVPTTKTKMGEAFDTMLEDSQKLYTPPRFSSFVTEPLREEPILSKIEGNKSKELFRCVKGLHALEAISSYSSEKITGLNKELEEKKTTVEERISKIVGLNLRSGNVLPMEQFKQYVALQRQLTNKLQEVLSTTARIHEEFDTVLNDTKKLYAPPSRFSRLITEPYEPPRG